MTRVVSRSGVVSRRSRWLGVQRRQLVEVGSVAGRFDGAAVDTVEPHQRVELLALVLVSAVTAAVAGYPHRAGHGVAATQSVLADHVHRHVDVVGAGQISGGAHECVVVEDVENAGDRLDDIVLAQFGLAAALAGVALAAAAPIAEPPAAPAAAAVSVVIPVLLVARITALFARVAGLGLAVLGLAGLGSGLATVGAVPGRALAAVSGGTLGPTVAGLLSARF